MSRTTLPPTPTRYHHEAYLWHGLDEFLGRTVPFVLEGLDQGMPVMVAVPHHRWRALRAELGAAADEVAYADMARIGRNPARILPAWRTFVDEHPDSPALRGVAEPVWAGRRAAEIAECQLHEALMNVAIPASAPLWLLCPYDADGLDRQVLEEVERTHPVVAHHGGSAPSPRFVPAPMRESIARRDLDAPGPEMQQLDFGAGELSDVRRTVRRAARDAGLDELRTDDLVLAVNEIAANSLDHGGGAGNLLAWREDDALVLEVRDGGRLADPLAGRVGPEPGQLRGRGLWIANHLADLVQIRQAEAGMTVRVSTWL